MDPPVPAPAPVVLPQVVTRALPWFHMLAIVIDVIPFLIVCCVQNLAALDDYFSIWSFINGAVTNYLLVCFILFTLKPMENMAALLVAIVGMCLGTACAFLLLLHTAVVHNDRSSRARALMFLLMVSLLAGSATILYGVDVGFHAIEEWTDAIITLVAAAAAAVLDLTVLMLAIFDEKPYIRAVDTYGMAMSFLATVDALFFVVYIHMLGAVGSLFACIGTLTAITGVAQFMLSVDRMIRR